MPTNIGSALCLATAAPSLICHLAFESTLWPRGSTGWLALLALGLGPVGDTFYLWGIGVTRGDIRLPFSYAARVLSTLALVLAGYTEPSRSLALACALIVAGPLIAAKGTVPAPAA